MTSSPGGTLGRAYCPDADVVVVTGVARALPRDDQDTGKRLSVGLGHSAGDGAGYLRQH